MYLDKDTLTPRKELFIIKPTYDFGNKTTNLRNILEKYKEKDFCYDNNVYYKNYLKNRGFLFIIK